MGPRPPLKRRPTYTPYTRPCKRDISAKLTPGRCKKPSYHPPCGSIYIYMHVCMHTQVDTVATNRYLTVTSLDIFRPLPTHFHPVCSAHTEIRPEYFRFPTFPPFRYPRSLFHPRVLHFHFASPLPSHFALHTRPSNETLLEKDSSPDRPYSLFFSLPLRVHSLTFLSTRGRNESAESMCSKTALGNAANISSGSSF